MGIVHRCGCDSATADRSDHRGRPDWERHVRFGQAVVSTCRDEVRPVAEEFSRFIASPRIQKLLLKYGFEQVSGRGRPQTRSAMGQSGPSVIETKESATGCFESG